MKTAKDVLDQWDVFFNSHGEIVDNHVLSAMEEYAQYKVKEAMPKWVATKDQVPEFGACSCVL